MGESANTSYIKEKEIAQGTFGRVYAAKSPTNDKVAVKVNMCDNEFDFSFSLRELEANIYLTHPFITPLYEHFRGNPFHPAPLVSPSKSDEYVGLKQDSIHFIYPLAKCDLFEYLKRGPISLVEIDKFMIHILLSIEYLHSLNIVHRDIKINNFLLFEEGSELVCKMTDFGFSKYYLPNQPQSPSISLPYFRSPEGAFENIVCDYKSDIWAAGCIFYELITEKTPFCLVSTHTNGKLEDINKIVMENIVNKLPGADVRKVRQEFPKIRLNKADPTMRSFIPLNSKRTKELGERKNSLYNLFGGMFKFSHTMRLSAKQCLDSPYFTYSTSHKDLVKKVRSEVVDTTSNTFYPNVSAIGHERLYKLVNDFFVRRKSLRWYSHRILFCSLELQSEMIDIQYSESKEPTNDEMYIQFLSTIYIFVKYFFNSTESEKAIKFASLDLEQHLSDASINTAKKYEELVISKMKFKIYRRTFYDLLSLTCKPSDKDVFGLLVFWYSGFHRNLDQKDAFKEWMYHRDYYCGGFDKK